MHVFLLTSRNQEQYDHVLAEKEMEKPVYFDANVMAYLRPTFEWLPFYDPVTKHDATIFQLDEVLYLQQEAAFQVYKVCNAWADLFESGPAKLAFPEERCVLYDRDQLINDLRLLASYANLMNYFSDKVIIHYIQK